MVAGIMAVMTASAAVWSSAPTTAAGWDAVLSPSSGSVTTEAPSTWTDTNSGLKVTWSFDYVWQTTKVYYSRSKNGIQLGSGSAGLKGMMISSDDFSGTISKVTLKGAKSNGSAIISVVVGDEAFLINGAANATLTSTATDCVFTGNASGKIQVILSGNADGKYIGFSGLEVVYEESVVTPVLGDITVTYGVDATPVVDGDILEGVVEGTVFTFSAENAESIVVTDSENTTIAQGVATADWTATVTDGEELTVTATLGEEEKTFTFMLEVVEAPQPDLGEIIVKYGDVVIENQYEDTSATPVELPLGATLSVSAENATVIQLMAGSGDNYVYKENIGNPATLTLNTLGSYPVTLFASRSDHDPQTKTFYFEANVVEAPQPVLGNIIVTYGDGIQVAEDDEVSVEVGTTFTFTAENATNITVERFMESLLVVNEDANTATWTPEFAFAQDGIIVTATDGTNESTFEFFLTVTEPVLPENEVWTLVTSMDDFVIGGKYIVTNEEGSQAMSNENNTNFRKITAVSVDNNELINPSEKVLRLTVEKDGDDYLWKTMNYLSTSGSISQVYLNVASGNSNYLYANNPQTGNEGRRNTSVAFDGNNVLITFVNAQFKEEENKRRIFFNTDRFTTYSEANDAMGKIKLFKLVEPQPEIPAFDLMEDDATKVALMSTKGELHVWTVEYDKDGNAVKENGQDVAASVMVKAPAADDTAWTNKVAEEGENYEIYVPVTAGNYLSIRAKSVLGDLHSEELVKNVDASGNIISSVEGVAVDDMNAPVEYFNLQGVRVAAEQPGLYIRRQGSKVEKVAIAR